MSDVNTNAAADTTKAAEGTEQLKTVEDTLYAKSDETKVSETQQQEKKEETKADDNAKDLNSKDAEQAPEKYELKADAEKTISEAQLDKIALYAKEKGLSQEAAQNLVDMQVESLKAQKQGLVDEFKQTSDSWRASAQADKEIGGDNFNRNVELAKRVVDRFGSDDFKKALNDTGFGNHPELLRLFVRVGQKMGEDTLVVPGSSSTKTRSVEDLFYGSNN